MDLINKILGGSNRLGAITLNGEPSFHFANAPKNRVKAISIGAVVIALVCVAGWLLLGSRQKIVAPVSVVQAPAKSISAPQEVLTPVSAPSAASSVGISQQVADAKPVAVIAKEILPKENGFQGSVPKELGNAIKTADSNPSMESDAAPSHNSQSRSLATKKRLKHHKIASLSEPDTGNIVSGDEPRAATVPFGGVNKKVKSLSVQQQADNEFRRANGLMQQGRNDEALAGYESALQLDAGHESARQALAVLLLQNKRYGDAERVLQEGLKLDIKNSVFAMLLARIQVDRDASWSALLVLQKTLPYAERQPDYQAFVAALLQRLNRHKESVTHYQIALQLSPNSGVWWMGLGISLRALQRDEEARVAFKHALESHTLNADLQTFVTQQLKG